MSRRLLWIATAVWLTIVIAGLAWLAGYDNRPGAAAHPPAAWPQDSRMVHDPVHPTLVMLAHPRCDCTRASLGELAELMARAAERPRAYVLFIRPAGVNDAWEKTSLWKSAGDIPGVTVLSNDDGREARRFGVATSGQTLLYASTGTLLFAGGTTGARGHPGDNAGRATILDLLEGNRPPQTASPVFGCDLFSPAVERELSTEPGAQHGT